MQQQARQIVALTTRFREAQDRLHIAVKDDMGGVTGLWLTRRLADRLVRKLVARLEGTVQVAQTETRSRAALHLWQQSIAQANQTHQAHQVPAAPVPEPAPEREALIESVDIGQIDHRLRLVFHCADTAPLALMVDGMQLRQLLGVVYRHYRLADWATEGVWPGWFAEAATQSLAPSERGLVVH